MHALDAAYYCFCCRCCPCCLCRDCSACSLVKLPTAALLVHLLLSAAPTPLPAAAASSAAAAALVAPLHHRADAPDIDASCYLPPPPLAIARYTALKRGLAARRLALLPLPASACCLLLPVAATALPPP